MNDDLGTLDGGMTPGGIHLGPEDYSNLRTAGKWGRFLGLVGLISTGLALVALVLFGGTMLAFMSDDVGGGEAVFGTGILFVYGLFFVLFLYPYWMLYQFSTKILTAVDTGNQSAATQAFASLKSMMKFIGIITAIVLALYAVIIVISIVGGATALVG